MASGTDVEQTQSTIPDFCRKIKVGKRAQITVEFMLIARIESLILGKGLEDAVERAIEYVKVIRKPICLTATDFFFHRQVQMLS
mmetsp:Transcript_24976/g.79125  ORF Transcript_24976/g.79125 Transcript_24976/m.79125 type:complete len:84 (-) Transcript_24976:1038-1289(-)